MLDSSKLKEFADDNFQFDKNCGTFSKEEENAVGKGEIVCNGQFLLFFHSVFKKPIQKRCKNKGFLVSLVQKYNTETPPLYHRMPKFSQAED